MPLSRRSFLKSSSLAAPSLLLPRFGPAALHGSGGPRVGARALVVIHLDGGNDGINTVVPFGDEAYADLRPTLRQREDRLHGLADGLGLHPSMEAFKALWDDGDLAIVQGVGYPDLDRSHFLGTSIWETAIRDPQQHGSVGWIGRALDSRRERPEGPTLDAVFVGDQLPPLALSGKASQATNLDSLRDFRVARSEALAAAAERTAASVSADDPRAILAALARGAYAAADRLADVDESRRSEAYPDSELARRLSLAATLIGNDHPARAYYLKHSGYDTHNQQVFTHGALLGDLTRSVRAFLQDVGTLGRGDDVTVMMFSEFGRTLRENGTRGTDHGSAGPVFVAGKPVQGGLIGETPSLTDLVDGEPRWGIDFREIYASLERDWLGGGCVDGFEPLPLFG